MTTETTTQTSAIYRVLGAYEEAGTTLSSHTSLVAAYEAYAQLPRYCRDSVYSPAGHLASIVDQDGAIRTADAYEAWVDSLADSIGC